MDVRTAIRVRVSTRRYADRLVDRPVLDRLLAAGANCARLTEPSVRLALVSGREEVGRILARYAGVYGLVQGAPYLLVGLIPTDSEQVRLDLGYVLEQVVLEATRLGLGTCWMTGSYRPLEAATQLGVGPEEEVAAAVALGIPRLDPLARLHDGAVRRIAAGHRRLPLGRLVYDGQWGQAWTAEGADPALVEVLECARLAPSAKNRQPWRFVVGAGRLSLALVAPAPIDAGIVMSHVTLARADLGCPGRWEVRLGDTALAHDLGLPTGGIPVAVTPWQ
jgi:nitroreductase